MRRALLLLAACGAPQHAPAPATDPTTWQKLGSTLWGVELRDGGFEVSYIDGTPLSRTSLDNGDHPRTVPAGALPAATPSTRAPAIEQADRDFAADTERDGVDGWLRHFDEHGAMWRRGHRVEGDDIRTSIAGTLGAGALHWEPVTSGARGDLGFTLGAATFTEPGGAPQKSTYCTIWKHEADGSWKVLFDMGRPVE